MRIFAGQKIGNGGYIEKSPSFKLKSRIKEEEWDQDKHDKAIACALHGIHAEALTSSFFVWRMMNREDLLWVKERMR